MKPGVRAGIETAENMMLPTLLPERDPGRSIAAAPALIHRAQAEFTEMPGLRLTVAQAARLWALDPPTSAAMLAALVRTGFLVQHGEHYSRGGSA